MRQLIFVILLTLVNFTIAFGQDTYLEKGNTYLNNNVFDKAEQTFSDGIKANPTNLIYQCQLGLSLVKQKRFSDAEKIFVEVLAIDSIDVAAIWYSGIGNFYAEQDKQAISRFEKALTLLNKESGQYYSANWFIGTCYSNLLKKDGLTYAETERMFECYEEYLKLQPNAKDAEKIKEYVERKKKRRPSSNVLRWIDR